MSKYVMIVHHLAHACAALQAAKSRQVYAVLQSAPDAAFYAGVLYLKAMMDEAAQRVPEASHRFIVDCADDPGMALEALRTGHRYLRSSSPRAAVDKLVAIAGRYKAEIYTEHYEALDLARAPHPLQAACTEWLAARLPSAKN